MTSRPPGPSIWREEFKLCSYQVDFQKRATLETLCRIFQEVAWNHAEALGVGFNALYQDQKVWALSRLLMQVRKYPRWGDTITASTWPRPTQGVFAMRDLEMTKDSGEVIVCSSSAWIILDLESRKPQRMDKILAGFDRWENRQALSRDPEKIRDFSSAGTTGPFLDVKYSDLDVNGHVNNARYVSWLMDIYPTSFHQDNEAALIEVNFLGESHGGDSLSICTQEIEPRRFAHGILRTETKAPVCRATIQWVASDGEEEQPNR